MNRTDLDPQPHAAPAPHAASALDVPVRLPAAELQAALHGQSVEVAPHLSRGELLHAWIAARLGAGERCFAEGALELLPEGFGFVRSPHLHYEPSPHDPFVAPTQVRALNLKNGHWLRGPLRPPRGAERFFALAHVDSVNGAPPHDLAAHVLFSARTPVLATRALRLDGDDAALRALAVLAPWQLGHRVLVTAPTGWPRAGWLLDVARALRADAPLRTFVCLLDQRPEALAAAVARADADQEVTGTTFDAPPERHAALADLVLARAMREVEAGTHVVLLLDSLTALAHATQRATPASGRWLCPGLDAQAVLPMKRLFAAARACAEGGSLTVIATALGDAEASAVDRAVLGELEHRANSDVVIDDALAAAGAPAPFAARSTRTRPEDDDRDAASLAAAQALRERLAAATTPETRAAVLAGRG
jgi:transcription termination factor Rho